MRFRSTFAAAAAAALVAAVFFCAAAPRDARAQSSTYCQVVQTGTPPTLAVNLCSGGPSPGAALNAMIAAAGGNSTVLGTLGGMDTAGASSTSAALGNILTNFGSANANFGGSLTFTSNPLLWNGTRTYSGSQYGANNGLIWSFSNVTGSTTTGNAVAGHFFGIASDTLQSSTAGFNDVFIQHTTGAGIKGTRAAINAQLIFNGTPADSNAQYEAGTFAFQGGAAANGANIGYGLGVSAGLVSGGTGFGQIVGQEIDIQNKTGSSLAQTTGLSIVLLGAHAVHGSSNLDSGLVFGNTTGASTGWDDVIRFCGPSNPCPFLSTTTLLYGYPGTSNTTIANFIDFHNFTATGFEINFGNFTVNGSGVPGLTPATWTDTQTCAAGQIEVDSGFIYVCTAANVAKRVALSTF